MLNCILFSGGLSVAEYESQGITPTVEYLRGPDMGGGVGGMMYSLRNGGTEAKYAMSNGRGDVVAQSNDAGALTWTASYEAYGKRPVETGTNLDRQRANTKEEDPTGLLNEGFRYRDIETGVWLSRDPAGFVDGPNLYAYVMQNPWTAFDPEGLSAEIKTTTANGRDETTFRIKASVVFEEGQFSEKEKDRLLKGVKDGLAATFNGSEGNHSWKADIDVKIVSTAKDAREGDHIFTILRDMKGAGGEGDFGGLNITLGGGEMLTFLEMHDMLRGALGENASSASDTFTLGTRKVSREIGHTLGLRHPFNLIPSREDAKWFPNDNKQLYPDGGFWVGRGLDDGNPISSLGAKNIMRYHPPGGKISKDSPVGMQLESSQVRLYFSA